MRMRLMMLVMFVAPMLMGASCNVLSTIRQVHMGVREAGRLADEQIAPRLENHGDVCLERADEAGFPAGSGQEGMDFWRDCMSAFIQLNSAVSAFKTALEELENVYDDVEAGSAGESDWQFWARRVLDHGRTMMRLCGEAGVSIPNGMQDQLDNLCALIQCEGEAS